MNEEQIIKIMKEIQEDYGNPDPFKDDSYYDKAVAIEGLLDLYYKKQKEIEEKSTIIMAGAEKVKQLEKEIEERDKYNITTLPFEELKEMIEQNKNISIFGKEYISKNKIREIFQFYIERDSLFNDNPHKMAVITLKDILQELLEEK